MSDKSVCTCKSVKVAACAAFLAIFVSWAAAGPPNYLIINAPTFTGSSGLNSLVAAKTAQGFNVTTKEFAAGSAPETIRAYIQQFWNTPDAPDYILLVGDSDTILPWFGQGTRHADTDLYYACMDGPDDWYPDVPIGRFPVRTTAQLTAVVNKTNYVEAGSYADPTYITRVAFLAGDDPGSMGPAAHDAMIEAYTTPAGLTPTRIYSPYPSGTGTPEISAAVNAGNLIVTYLSHSGSMAWWDPALNQDDVNALTNANKYCLVLSLSCDTADFTALECFGETWLRKSNGGAAAFISATDRIFYLSEQEWESVRRLENYIFRAFFEDGEYRVGPALQKALYYFLADPDYGPAHEYTLNYFEEFTVLGDPSLHLPIRGFQIDVDPPLQSRCTPATQVQYTIQVEPHAGFNQAVTLSASGYPAGWNVSFSQNTQPPPFTTVMTVSNISGAPGMYEILLTGTSAQGLHRYAHPKLHLATGVPGTVVLSDPPAGATAVSRSPVLTWQAATQAAEYELQVALDYAFTDVVYTAITDLTSHNVDDYLLSLTDYYWRVRGINGCGAGPYSAIRSFTTVPPPNYFTEQFPAGVSLDLQYHTYYFIPNGSADFYEVCGEEATALPTNPAGGYMIELYEDSYEVVYPSRPISLYGNSYSYVFVNSNGNITFNNGDSTAAETLAVHFNRPRVSALFTDLSAQLGSVTYKNTADRLAITYQNVPERYSSSGNTFQVELFYDTGEIHITWLQCPANGAIVGLSAGQGVPDDFVPSDFTDYPCAAACCHADATCTVTEQAACVAPDLWYPEWPDCAVADCQLMTGACCHEDGTCEVTEEFACTSPSVWHAEWADCSVADCPQPAGACCFDDGHCEELAQAQCLAGGGEWLADASCAPNPCVRRGDANCDGAVNVFDIDPFVLALVDMSSYQAEYGCTANADCNCDGDVNVFDIDPFVECLVGECPDCP